MYCLILNHECLNKLLCSLTKWNDPALNLETGFIIKKIIIITIEHWYYK